MEATAQKQLAISQILPLGRDQFKRDSRVEKLTNADKTSETLQRRIVVGSVKNKNKILLNNKC